MSADDSVGDDSRPKTRVVAYDSHGVFSAPRLWLTMQVFGHANAAVLDGGLPRWVELGLASTSASQPDQIDALLPRRPPRTACDLRALPIMHRTADGWRS